MIVSHTLQNLFKKIETLFQLQITLIAISENFRNHSFNVSEKFVFLTRENYFFENTFRCFNLYLYNQKYNDWITNWIIHPIQQFRIWQE